MSRLVPSSVAHLQASVVLVQSTSAPRAQWARRQRRQQRKAVFILLVRYSSPDTIVTMYIVHHDRLRTSSNQSRACLHAESCDNAEESGAIVPKILAFPLNHACHDIIMKCWYNHTLLYQIMLNHALYTAMSLLPNCHLVNHALYTFTKRYITESVYRLCM